MAYQRKYGSHYMEKPKIEKDNLKLIKDASVKIMINQ